MLKQRIKHALKQAIIISIIGGIKILKTKERFPSRNKSKHSGSINQGEL